jgi:hypothetical protein
LKWINSPRLVTLKYLHAECNQSSDGPCCHLYHVSIDSVDSYATQKRNRQEYLWPKFSYGKHVYNLIQ